MDNLLDLKSQIRICMQPFPFKSRQLKSIFHVPFCHFAMDLPDVMDNYKPHELEHAIVCMVYYLFLDAEQNTWEELAGTVIQVLLTLRDVCARACAIPSPWRTYEPCTQCLHEALVGASIKLSSCLTSPVTLDKFKKLVPRGKSMERSRLVEILQGYHNDMSGYIGGNPTFSKDHAQLSEIARRFQHCSELLSVLHFFQAPLDEFVKEVQVLLQHGSESAQGAMAASTTA